jgi:hypothetical protein
MKEKFNMENKHLKENPYTVPDGYFSTLQESISERVSSSKRETRFWNIARPQLALVASFAVVFLIAYATINLFSPGDGNGGAFATEETQIEALYVKTSFVDFYDSSADTLYSDEEESIDPEEIVEYLSSNTGIIYLASLD